MSKAAGHLVFETAGGPCGVAWSGAGILRFQLPAADAAAVRRLLLRDGAVAGTGAPPDFVRAAVTAVQRYFSGEAVDFTDVPLDLSAESGTFRTIYAETRRLRWGETTTYGALARAVDAGPEGARLVGQAMARNPVALIIPCHRVLAAGGRVGGFSAPGGAQSKLKMLALEGIGVGPPPSAQRAFGF